MLDTQLIDLFGVQRIDDEGNGIYLPYRAFINGEECTLWQMAGLDEALISADYDGDNACYDDELLAALQYETAQTDPAARLFIITHTYTVTATATTCR